MTTCRHCKKEYDETNVNIPNPLLDYMCAFCGTQLTEEDINAIIAEFIAPNTNKT